MNRWSTAGLLIVVVALLGVINTIDQSAILAIFSVLAGTFGGEVTRRAKTQQETKANSQPVEHSDPP